MLPAQPVTSAQRSIFHGPVKKHRSDIGDSVIDLQAGEVLVSITMTTICGSALHTYEGRRHGHLDSILGHEGVGVIISVGEGRDPSLVGKRVTWTLTDSYGFCKPCIYWDIPQKCVDLFKYGYDPMQDEAGLNGAFANHIVLPKGTDLVELPENLSESLVAPANGALATMVAVVETIPSSANRVLIQGAGLLGIYGAALLKDRGVKEVWVTDRVQERLDQVKEFGATPIHAKDLNSLGENTFDAVIEVAGVSQIISDGISLLRPGGFYVWAGMVHTQTPLTILGMDVVKGCITIIGVHNYSTKHLDLGVNFLTKTATTYPWKKLVSPPLPLFDLDKEFELTQSRKWHRVSTQPNLY